MGKNLLKKKFFAGIFVCALLFSGCANDGEPETWEDQDGLVARNFVEACQESNSDMSTYKAKSYCECVINRVKDSLVFKSIHEICYLDGYIWVTSTAYDAIVQVDLNFNICNIYKINGRSLHDYKVLESKDSVSKSDLTNDDNFHINSISSENGRVVFSGLITHLYDLETMNVVSAMPTLNGSKSFQHNFYEYEDFSLINLTSFKYLGINKDVGCDFIVIPRSRNVKYHVDTIAENNWNRGLARSGDIVFVGSSPARILMLDIRTQKLLKEIQLEEPIKTLGNHFVEINLDHELSAKVKALEEA